MYLNYSIILASPVCSLVFTELLDLHMDCTGGLNLLTRKFTFYFIYLFILQKEMYKK